MSLQRFPNRSKEKPLTVAGGLFYPLIFIRHPEPVYLFKNGLVYGCLLGRSCNVTVILSLNLN
jgi:hypothetical protein